LVAGFLERTARGQSSPGEGVGAVFAGLGAEEIPRRRRSLPSLQGGKAFAVYR